MSSEIRANKQTNRAGLGTVTYADTGIIVSGIVTCTELSGLTALNIAGVGTASTLDINGDIDVDGHTNLDNVSIAGVTTTTGILYNNSYIKVDSTQDQQLNLNSTDNGAVYMALQRSGTRKAWMGYGSNTSDLTLRNEGSDGDLYLSVNDGGTQINPIHIDASENGKANITKDLDVDGHTNLDNVSIAGVTTMSSTLNVSGNTNLSSELRANANIRMTNAGPKITFIDDNHNPDYEVGNSDGVFRIRDATSSVNRLAVSSTGNISILNDLDVDGHTNLDNVSISGISSTGNIYITTGGDGRKLSFAGDGSSHYIKMDHTLNGPIINGYGGIAFETNGTNERLRITSGGNVQVNGGALHLDASGELAVFETDTNLAFTNSAKLAFDFSGNIARIRTSGNGSFTSRNLGFYFANSQKLLITTDKVMFSADAKVDTNNNRDLGATGSRWKGLYLGTLLDVDTNDATDGHIMAQFNGVESGANHAGLMIAHYLCGSDDNRTGLYWEHQNVSNQRMWMGDDLRLYLKSSNPTSSTQNGRYIMTVAAGYPDFPSGSSADNAAYSALEIKKHYPNSQSGNYWIYDNNNTPRQIYCDMEIDGGGWMLWHDHNYGQTSMNEALGGTGLNPTANLARGNWGNYAYYNVLIRATQIDATGERLHSIVQLDGNGALKRIADYGSDFLYEDVGDLYQPNLNYYFNSGTTGEYVGNTMMYSPQCGATGWENFSNGGNSAVFIREMDSRLTPGMHRSCHLVERIYNFDSNGIPSWTIAESMHPTPHWSDFSVVGGEAADGTNPNIQTHNVEINSMNGNNGPSVRARARGVLTGTFEYTFQLGYNWGWSIGSVNATIGIENALKAESTDPYSAYTNPYYHASLYNNSSNNLWYPTSRAPWQSSDTSSSNSPGINYGNHVIWRETNGTIKVRDKSGTHSTYTFPVKFAGPLIMCSGSQSPHYTKLQSVWNSAHSDALLNGRNRWYK